MAPSPWALRQPPEEEMEKNWSRLDFKERHSTKDREEKSWDSILSGEGAPGRGQTTWV